MSDGASAPGSNEESMSPAVAEGYVKLVSDDGHAFLIETRYAETSNVLRAMLAGHFREAHTRTISLPARGIVVEKLCQYLHYQRRRHCAAQMSASGAALAKGEVAAETFSVPPELAEETFNAAFYLEI